MLSPMVLEYCLRAGIKLPLDMEKFIVMRLGIRFKILMLLMFIFDKNYGINFILLSNC